MEKRKKIVDLKAVSSFLEDGDDEQTQPQTKTSAPPVQEYSPDEELIQSTARIKHQRDLIKKRFAKMERSQDRVSRNVFEKVKRDYNHQLESINRLYDEKKEKLNEELKNLYLLRERQTVEINRHKEILEEAQFRHFLEEFSEEQYKEVEAFESREIHRLQSILSKINAFIKVHEELFDSQEQDSESSDQATEVESSQDFSVPPSSDVTRTMVPEAQSHTEVADDLPPLTQLEEDGVKPEGELARTVEESVSDASVNQALSSSPNSESKPAASVGTKPVSEYSNLDHEPKSYFEATDESSYSDESSDDQADNDLVAPPQSGQDLPDLNDQALADSEHTPPVTKAEQDQLLEDNPPSLADLTPATGTPLVGSVSQEKEYQTEVKPAPSAPTSTVSSAAGNDTSNKEPESIFDVLGDVSTEAEPDTGSHSEETHSQVSQPSSPQVPSAAVASAPAPKTQPTDANAEYKLAFIEAEGDLEMSEFMVKDNVSIGRSPSNDLVLKAAKVSRQHAAINKYKDQYIVIDLKSSNGVFVNGQKIDEKTLEEGDEVSIGGYKMVFKRV